MLLLNIEQKIKIQCGICHFMARDQEDVEKIADDGCCTECYKNFRYVYAERWNTGERPTLERARQLMHIY